jgi:predicted nucleotidyltransferase
MNNIIHKITNKRKVIELLLKYPEREFTVNELSRDTATPYATTWRLIQELDRSGLVSTRTIGHSTVCKLNKESPFLKEIKKVLEAKPTPQKAVIKDFINKIKKVDGIKKVILFGSVARDQEKLTSDIDIAVVTKGKKEIIEKEVNEIVDEILQKSKMVIVPLFLTEKEMKENKQFEEEIKKGKILYERNN